LYITSLAEIGSAPLKDGQVIIYLHPDKTLSDNTQCSPRELHIALGPHKIGSRNLRTALATITSFVSKAINPPDPTAEGPPSKELLIACSTGKDHSVGVGLALLCLFFDDEGKLLGLRKESEMDKLFIRRRLGWIMTCMPGANPSSATLQSVNSFLMGRPA
jgi:tRNA A64-2'-O-ribosylphosphate transferase